MYLLNFLRCSDFPWTGWCLWKRYTICQIPVSSRPTHRPCCCTSLATPYKANSCEHVNEELRGIELRRNAKLRCCVVKRIFVVPVVPSFADRTPRHEWILCRVGQNVIGVVSHQVRCGVDTPSKVQYNHVSQSTGNKKGGPEVLVPEILSNKGGHHVAHKQCEPRVKFLLKCHHWIILQVRKVHISPSFHNSRVLLDK